MNRGNAWQAMKWYDKAISDLNEAARLDPKNAKGVRRIIATLDEAKGDDKAIEIFDAVIRSKPDDATATLPARTLPIRQAQGRVFEGTKTLLEIATWRSFWSMYAVLLRYFAARLDGHIDQANGKYLRGEINETRLLSAATDDDKPTEVQCYPGLDMLLKGRPESAITHFRWVKERGNPEFNEYPIALAELKRLLGK